MPLYEYKCEDCENEFEEMLHFSERDDPINEPCLSCKGKVQLKMSMGSFHLKGSGWYKDGYVKKPQTEKR
jgi:putative FmdB family regulatory protein